MPINPHLTPRCDFCVHSTPPTTIGEIICANQESEYYNFPVLEEAKDCNLYRLDTNIDEIKEQQKEGW